MSDIIHLLPDTVANQIAARIEEGSQYPGMVLVTVVRENRQQACAQ